MTDFLCKYGAPGQTAAQAEAGIDAVAQAIAVLWIPASSVAGKAIPGQLAEGQALSGKNGEWTLMAPFQWYKPTGAMQTDQMSGQQVPIMAADGYTYRVFRWDADLAALAPYVTAAGGVMTTDPTTGAITITAGPVTMTSPLPADCPQTFG